MFMKNLVFLGLCIIGFECASAQVVGFAPQVESDSIAATTMPQVHLVTVKDRLLTRVPGSVAVINAIQINKISPLSGNDVVKKIPGLNVVDEEGAGLRINIGIRGLDPDRSRNILMMVDGIPVALNPYGEPEMYFTPVIDKVKAVEVLKGSGQILFGPQTIGGVVNFITATPPSKETAIIKVRAGENGFFSGYTSYGNTVGNTGFLISYLHKRANNLGPTKFAINDLSAKIHFHLNERSSIGVKLGLYDEVSNSTYIGLTQTMYDSGGQDFVRMAPDDLLPVRRYNASITHQYKINSKIQLLTNVFTYTTTRNWRRQEFTASKTAANKTGVIWGDTTVAGGAIYMLNANGHRNRQFEVMGFEPQLKIETSTGMLKHELQLGARLLLEKANEQFIIGKKPTATAGDLRDDEVRSGLALSAYVQDKIKISPKLSINAGIRIENLDYKRQIYRGRFTINGSTVTADTNVIAKGNVFAFIPGAGFNFEANDQVNIYGGIHKGFAPPRTKDAITSTGIPLNIEEEKSWNTELGFRTQLQKYISAEFTGFYMKFNNQIIPISQSSGQSNATGLANGGATKHIGIEAAIEADVAKSLGASYSIIIGGNITYVHSKFSADRFINKSGTLTNVKGNKLPYAPSLIFNTSLGFEGAKGYGIRFFGNYTDEQYTDELNSTVPAATGLTGIINSRFILDATVYYPIKKDKISFSISAKNLTNERYIVSRRPQGIKVGLDRQVTAGVNIKL
jgi:Fe(3+) dicitrate transport protein